MLCGNCGKKLEPLWVVCPFCGRAVSAPEACGKPVAPVEPILEAGVCDTTFIPSFKPYKAEKKPIVEWEDNALGHVVKDNYPYGYDNEVFRSSAEVEWAKTFDRVGLRWEYEPLKFDMGPHHFSYTPDFTVSGLSVPGFARPLYIEIKRFPDVIDVTKYVRFTKWYDCDLLVLAHEKGGVLEPKKKKYFVLMRCARCDTYDCFSFDELRNLASGGSAHLPERTVHWEGIEWIVVESYFLIQAGTIRKAGVVFGSNLTKPKLKAEAEKLAADRQEEAEGKPDGKGARERGG